MTLTSSSWITELALSYRGEAAPEGTSSASSWEMVVDTGSTTQMARIDGIPYRLVRTDSIGYGFSLGLLGAQYEWTCSDRGWSHPLHTVLEREATRGRYYTLVLHLPDIRITNHLMATLLEDRKGDMHLIEVPPGRSLAFWLLLTSAAHILAERNVDPARFDDFGDFLGPGAPSVVHRHSTERLRKHISQKVVYDPGLCTQCLRCATLCNEMKVIATEKGAQILGPSEDFCTNCGLCQKRCSFLAARPKSELHAAAGHRSRMSEGGAGIHFYGPLATEYLQALDALQNGQQGSGPYSAHTQLDAAPDLAAKLPVKRQVRLDWTATDQLSSRRPLLVTSLGNGHDHEQTIIRTLCRTALVLQTGAGDVELEMALAAMKLGLDVRPIVDAEQGSISLPNNGTTRLFHRMGRPATAGRSLFDLWARDEADLFLAPFADRVPAELHRQILEDTGRQAQILAPHITQALPFTKSPLLGQLNRELASIFERHPELMEAEARYAEELLRDIPRSSILLHARYRSMAFGSGHTACPTCAEAQVLAIPVYMAMAMSLARREVPRVTFTSETGCMSETLNKTGEVAQKVPGGRTVFGGGFAFGEAVSMAQDRAIRMGHLKKGRRYVVSQGGDGGAVIGLPAWLNALRQQASLIRQRHPNVLHFINITDTQVYSNTGGESSASSLLGMGTLTTPIGKFLLGNQKIQWTLINLAAEFPGVLVGAGHSGDRTAMQQFWQLADQTGQSAIRWDITPCPETGKFFGEDPDDLAEVMAHAGMIPQVVFVGRFRKRIAPFRPEDRSKPPREWDPHPKPILYWLLRDPRYRPLFRKDPQTGKQEPRNLTAHFLISQLESYRDQINWQIDLETLLVRRAEEWVAAFFRELKETWSHYRYRLEQFPYALLFNRFGELKPEYSVGLEQEMIRRILGWDEMVRLTDARDQAMGQQQDQTERFLAELEKFERLTVPVLPDSAKTGPETDTMRGLLARVRSLDQALKQEASNLRKAMESAVEVDPVEKEIFPSSSDASRGLSERRGKALFQLLDRIIEERALAKQVELQQYRLAQQLKQGFLREGGLIREKHAVSSIPEQRGLLEQIRRLGPFSIGVASLAGDRGIAINRIFANFFTAKGSWAGMAWQFGSSKRGTPVLSATFVDSRPLRRKDAMYSFPMAVLTVMNYEEMKREPDIFFSQLRPGGFLIINHNKDPEVLWTELLDYYPREIRKAALEALTSSRVRPSEPLTARLARSERDPNVLNADMNTNPDTILDGVALTLYEKPFSILQEEQKRLAVKVAAMVTVRMISCDMNGIMLKATGSSKVVSNLVAVAPMFQALEELGFVFAWERDLAILTQGFPEAVLKSPPLLDYYHRAMRLAREETRVWSPTSGVTAPGDRATDEARPGPGPASDNIASDTHVEPSSPARPSLHSTALPEESPADYLMIMGGTLAGMVLSQIATAEHPLFYVGFPITPAGNPFYAMADAFANGHPHIVVDEVNPSEKVAAEKLLGVGRTGGFLPVTFTASQGWRLFTEIIPQYVGARLEGLFLIAKRALAAPNLNIEESHTDFMSFRDDGGLMLAPKSIQEYVPALYLARLLTHFARLPVILSIGGITDTHKIGLVKVPSDNRVREWLKETLRDFDFLEDKLINRQGDIIVHGPSGTSAVYQETQSEIEKAHQAANRAYPHAVEAVFKLTGMRLDEVEVATRTAPEEVETLLILEGSLYPNAVEALEELEEAGWHGMACISIRSFNPFPEKSLFPWFENAKRIVALDRSNSFGSIPPIASRTFTALARYVSFTGAKDRKVLRTLVGGLGGREITVNEMKDILLSTHLLFQPPERWEGPLIGKWIEEDEMLAALLHEAAALEIRNTDRHTRVPSHLRTREARRDEYRSHLEQLKATLIDKNYPLFLANYHQVEFIGPREVLQETGLLQKVVLHLEVRLARHAIENGLATWRHALIVLHYGPDPADRERAAQILKHQIRAYNFSPVLGLYYGVTTDIPQHPAGDREATSPTRASVPAADTTGPAGVCPLLATGSHASVSFDPLEAERIVSALAEMVSLQAEKPLFYNPEDYEYEMLERFQNDPRSALYKLKETCEPDRMVSLIQDYQICYRDVIDRTLQREVLTQHHAPELTEIFEGEGRKRLEKLVARLQSLAAEEPRETKRKTITLEVERYLVERCLPLYPKTPLFYLEYYRSWVAPGLIEPRQPT